MADMVSLSLWLSNYNESAMLEFWKRVIEAFPASASSPGIGALTIYPLNWGESPVLERSFGEGLDASEVVEFAAEFLHEDYAYEVQMNWDLWFPKGAPSSGNWIQTPTALSIACLGPEFDREGSDNRSDLQVNFGLDTPFLPFEEDSMPPYHPAWEIADLRTRENLQKLIGFVHRLDGTLPVKKRLLSCESGENLAEKILEIWNLRI